MSTITQVSIGGRLIDLSSVEYQVSVQRGASAPWDGPQASTCSVSVRTASAAIVEALQVGGVLLLDVDGARRFTGRVSDVSIDHTPGSDVAKVSIRGMGNLAQLGQVFVGSAGYAAEASTVRAANIINDAGYTPNVNMDEAQTLNAYTGGAQPALQLLGDVASWCGASVYDDANGYIVFAAYRNRINPFGSIPWKAVASTKTWGSYSATSAWSAQAYDSATLPSPVDIPPAAIVFEPKFSQQLSAVANVVQVSYGTASPQATTSATDSNSVTAFGTRKVSITTQLDNLSDASDRASAVTNAQSYPRWTLGNVTVALDDLTTAQQSAITGLRPGDRVTVTGLPQPAPAHTMLGIVEGYTETWRPNEHRMTLAISDPRASYGTAAWSAISGTKTWGTVNATRKWFDIVAATDVN